MDIWQMTKWKKYYDKHPCRKGLRLHYDKSIHPEVKRAVNEYIKWLRTKYLFPKRVCIYVRSKKQIRARDGDFVSDIFFWPYNREDEPYINIATGNFEHQIIQRGKDDALASILFAVSANLTHYYRWLNDIQLTPIGEVRQATKYARMRLDEYAETRDHP